MSYTHGQSGYRLGCRCDTCRGMAGRLRHKNRRNLATARIQWALDRHGNVCARCGVEVGKEKHDYEFHHVNPEEKEMEPTQAAWHASQERFMDEIAKCVLLCPPCHWGEVT